jgi:two-component sensor histidine kinase
LVRLQAVRLGGRQVSYSAHIDITARKAAEARQKLLARELDHRAKNILAVVQAALRLTPRDDTEAYKRAIEGRVGALARAHSLLAETRWEKAELRALLEGELALFLAEQRVELRGPPVTLPPGATQPLAMAVMSSGRMR